MRTIILLFCIIAISVAVLADDGKEALRETARLGSAEYNISIRFLQDDIWELTPGERDEKMANLSKDLDKGALSPLHLYELLQLLNMEGKQEDEKKVIGALSVLIESIRAKDPQNHEAMLVYAKLKQWHGDNSGLLTLLSDSTLHDETYISLLLELAHVHMGNADYENAEDIVDHILRFDSLNAEVLATKTLIRATSKLLKLLDEELAEFSNMVAQAPSEHRLGIAIANINMVFDSINFAPAQQAIELEPGDFRYTFMIGAVQEFIVYLHYLMLLGTCEPDDHFPDFTQETVDFLSEIKSYLDSALKNKPNGDIDAYMAMAMYHLVLKDFEKAKEFARQAIETRPDLDQSYDALITIINFQRMVIDDDSEAGFLESIEVLEKKKNRKTLNLVDRLMFLHPLIFDGKYEEVLTRIDAIKKDFCGNNQLLLFESGVYLRMDALDKSLDVLVTLQHLDPNNVDIWYNLGLCFYLKSDFDKALVHLNHALLIAPSDEDVLMLINKAKSSR